METAVKWDYQTDRALIVPHVGNLVNESFPEDFLVRLYLRTKQEGLLRRTFPGTENFSLGWFVSYFFPRTMLIGVAKPGKLAGYAWVYDADKVKASVGVCFFREYWGTEVIQDLAHLGLEWFFRELDLKIIYGTVAAWNRSSVRYAKLMGFEPCGCLPRFFLSGDSIADNHILALKRESLNGWRS